MQNCTDFLLNWSFSLGKRSMAAKDPKNRPNPIEKQRWTCVKPIQLLSIHLAGHQTYIHRCKISRTMDLTDHPPSENHWWTKKPKKLAPIQHNFVVELCKSYSAPINSFTKREPSVHSIDREILHRFMYVWCPSKRMNRICKAQLRYFGGFRPFIWAFSSTHRLPEEND
jgi:hypothetical protein